MAFSRGDIAFVMDKMSDDIVIEGKARTTCHSPASCAAIGLGPYATTAKPYTIATTPKWSAVADAYR
ncbi:MAG: hypothetical protein HY820_24735 [Acidobacteria bacterium]|nr:hypothetical protein [Acidobacteriota bacterium]